VTLDLVVVILALASALFGAISGASKQIAHLASMVAAYFLGRPLGELAAPLVADSFGLAPGVASVLGAMCGFILVLVITRLLLTLALRKLLTGDKKDEDRTTDRALGFVLGGGKLLALAYLLLSAVTFVESNVKMGKTRLKITPRDSWTAGFARQHNLFSLAKIPAVDQLVKLTQAASDPETSKRLAQSSAFKKLERDPRVNALLNDPEVRRALERGDTQALISHPKLLELARDPRLLEQVRRSLSDTHLP
jgi:membrane protein required for colicin V production